MPPDPIQPGGARPVGPVVLRIKLRYDDVEAMINRFAPNVGKSGLFLPTKSLQPVGSEVKFELRLANDTAVLLGLGRVKVTKPPDPANPKASFGMAIELMRVTRESRDLILRMLERRKQLGLPEVAIPMPADLDAARRSDFIDTAVRDPVSAPIPTALASAESGASEALLTSPRRASGPLAVAKSSDIEPLAPEPPRKRRPMLAELIERASGSIGGAAIGGAAISLAAVSVPGLDEEVDVRAVIARARALAGGDLDGELEALRESQATPIAIDIEAASAELARQLGGVAVRRGQSAPTSWAPPPAIAEQAKVEIPVEQPKALAITEARAPVEEVVPQELDELIGRGMVAPEPADTALDLDTQPPGRMFHDAITAIGRPEPVEAPAVPEEQEEHEEPEEHEEHEEHEVEPEQIHDEIHTLGESDFEEVEHTQIGSVESAFEQSVLAEKLDAHLAEVEEQSAQDDLGIGEASGHYLRSKIGLPPAEIYEDEPPAVEAEPAPPARVTPLPPEYQQDFIHRFDPEPDAFEAAPYVDEVPAGAQSYTTETVDAFGHTVDASLLGQAEQDAEEIEEIEDFEILAEADEEDEDLLSSSGEDDVSGAHQAADDPDAGDQGFTLPPANESDFAIPQRESDFAMRLDLGDDDPVDDPYAQPADPYPQQANPYPQAGAVEQPMHLAASAGHALAGFDDDDDPSHSFTFAEAHAPVGVDFDEPHSGYAPGFTPPSRFDQSDVIPVTPLTQSQLAQSGRTKRPTNTPMRALEPEEDPVATPPYKLRGPPPDVGWDEASSRNQWAKAPASPPSEEIDLESALEALDVDLDDLSAPGAPVPHAATELAREASPRRPTGSAAIRPPTAQQASDGKARKSARVPRGRAPRASTEDGVLIDFDDDDE